MPLLRQRNKYGSRLSRSENQRCSSWRDDISSSAETEICLRTLRKTVRGEKSNCSTILSFDQAMCSVFRYFKPIQYSCSELPEVLSIDEFKGNTSGEKYQTILTDAKNKTILDILPNRKEQDLKAYFSKFKNREDVQYFVCDMNPHFRSMRSVAFPMQKSLLTVTMFHGRLFGQWNLFVKPSRKNTSNCSVHISNAPENFLTKKIYLKRICGSLPLSLKMLCVWQKLTA